MEWLKRLKDWIINFKYYIIAFIVLIVLLSISITQCTVNVKQLQIDKATYQRETTLLKTNLHNYYLTRETERLDSLKLEEQKIINESKDKIKQYEESIYNLTTSGKNLEEKYNELLKSNAPCEELLEVSIYRLNNCQAENNELNKMVDEVNNEAESYSRQLFLCEKQRFNSDTIITNLNTIIKADSVLIAKYQKKEKAKKVADKVKNIVTGAIILAETTVILIKSQ